MKLSIELFKRIENIQDTYKRVLNIFITAKKLVGYPLPIIALNKYTESIKNNLPSKAT